MNRAGRVSLLHDNVGGLRPLGKIEKVFLNNLTLTYALSEEKPNVGKVRKTFFFKSLKHHNSINNI